MWFVDTPHVDDAKQCLQMAGGMHHRDGGISIVHPSPELVAPTLMSRHRAVVACTLSTTVSCSAMCVGLSNQCGLCGKSLERVT